VDVTDEATTAWEAKIAEWIEAEDDRAHLVAQNYCNFLFPVKSLVPDVSIVNFHYAYPEAVRFNYGLGKAISYDESGFLGQQDAAYIRQAWNFMLSGGSAFDGLDYSFTVGHEDGTETRPNGPGGGSVAFRRSLQALGDLLHRLPLASVHPDSTIVQHAEGVYVRMLSAAAGRYAAYLDGAGPVALILRLPSGSYAVEWIDPATGRQLATAQVQSNSEAVTLKTPDFKTGLALYIAREQP
jgi:hypothetical protein